jgi:hypothetical protein
VVKTKSSRACPVCGTPFTGELCPVCVLRGALGNEQTVSQSTEPTLSPSQLRFEHYEVLTLDDGTPLGPIEARSIMDPLRKDPRFDKLLAELAPKD